MSDGNHGSDDLDWDRVARVRDEYEGCFAIVPDQEIAKPKRSYVVPHPSKRTKEQHLLAAHLMRESEGECRSAKEPEDTFIASSQW